MDELGYFIVDYWYWWLIITTITIMLLSPLNEKIPIRWIYDMIKDLIIMPRPLILKIPIMVIGVLTILMSFAFLMLSIAIGLSLMY